MDGNNLFWRVYPVYFIFLIGDHKDEALRYRHNKCFAHKAIRSRGFKYWNLPVALDFQLKLDYKVFRQSRDT